MWYNKGYEKTHFCTSPHPRRTTPDPGRIALKRRLCVAALPDNVGIIPRGTSPCDRSPTWLRRPDGPQRDHRLQHDRVGDPQRRLFTPPPPANDVQRGRLPAITGPLASQSARLWLRSRRVDLRV